MLIEMIDWLKAKCKGVLEVDVSISHTDRASSKFTLTLNSPTHSLARIYSAFEGRLELISLPSPANGIGIRVSRIEEAEVAQRSIVPDNEAKQSEYNLFLESLVNRLGKERVLVVDVNNDLRPECQTRYLEVVTAKMKTVTPSQVRSAVEGASHLRGRDRLRQPNVWMFSEPKRLQSIAGSVFYEHERLIYWHGPDRIRTPWWSGKGQTRDYYVAYIEGKGFYWIFSIGQGDERHWYAQGVFA